MTLPNVIESALSNSAAIEEFEGLLSLLPLPELRPEFVRRAVATAHHAAAREREDAFDVAETAPEAPAGAETFAGERRARERGTVISGEWVLETYLGRGSFGDAWAARDARGTACCMKVLHTPVTDDLFLREIAVCARLKHPNIAQFLACGVDSMQGAWLATELVHGPTLDLRVGSLPCSEQYTVGILLQILSALEHAHSEGVVHCDLKPANVLLTENQGSAQVKIVDWGAAVEPDVQSSVGSVCGTPSYMAPEQVRGESVDHRTDICATGRIAFRLACGRDAYRGPPVEVLRQILTMPAPLPTAVNPELSPGLASVIVKATARDPSERYQTAAEMRQALASLRPNAVTVREDTRVGETTPRLRRPALSRLATVVAFGVSLVGLLLQLSSLIQHTEEGGARGEPAFQALMEPPPANTPPLARRMTPKPGSRSARAPFSPAFTVETSRLVLTESAPPVQSILPLPDAFTPPPDDPHPVRIRDPMPKVGGHSAGLSRNAVHLNPMIEPEPLSGPSAVTTHDATGTSSSLGELLTRYVKDCLPLTPHEVPKRIDASVTIEPELSGAYAPNLRLAANDGTLPDNLRDCVLRHFRTLDPSSFPDRRMVLRYVILVGDAPVGRGM